MLANELGTERRFALDELLTRNEVASALAVPLRGRPRPLGVLAVYSLEARSYVQDDVNLLRSAGNVLRPRSPAHARRTRCARPTACCTA